MGYSDISLLYVEDETEIRDRIYNELKITYPGMSIHAAGNGMEGLEKYRSHHPQIVITDISMPVMDGVTMVREIKSFNQEVIVIAVTAFTNSEYLLGAIEAGINHYLLKPVEYDKLFEVLDRNIENLRLKQQVRKSEALYRTLFNSIDEGFCIIQMIFDHNENPVDYRFLETNPAFEEQSGLINVVGRSINELVPGQEQHWFQMYGKIALTGQPARFDDLASQMGRWFDVYAFRFGQPEDRQVAVLFNDITERKRAEEELRLAREQLQMITDLMAAGVYYSSRGRRYLWVSQAYAKWLGRLPEEMIGRTIEEIVGTETNRLLTPYIDQVLLGEQISFESWIKYGGNESRWITAIYTPTRGRDGTPDGWVAVVTDITDRKQLELELQQAKEQLENRVAERTAELDSTVIKLREEIVERNKTELALKNESRQLSNALQELHEKEQLLVTQSRAAAMGETLGFIGHQWRQPLNSLGLIVQELSLSCELGDLTQEHLNQSTDKVMQVIRHMSQTIDDFRNFFKSNKKKVSFRLADVISKTIKLAETSFLREFNLPVDVTVQEDVIAEGYPNEYSQVILNILQNAVDAVRERNVEQPRIFIRIFKEKEKAVMTIADNAGGIPEENLDKLFDSYFTTKGPDKGTGIGLFISKTIIEKNMGGSLTVRNTGEGAEFRIEV